MIVGFPMAGNCSSSGQLRFEFVWLLAFGGRLNLDFVRFEFENQALMGHLLSGEQCLNLNL